MEADPVEPDGEGRRAALVRAVRALVPADMGAEVVAIAPDPGDPGLDDPPGASPRRRAEHRAGRLAARRALAGLGGPDGPVGRGPLGEPTWPEGYGGSITHHMGWAVAVVHRDPAHVAIGIDLFDLGEAEGCVAVADSFLHPDDRRHVATAVACARAFSAKECAAKVLSPRLGTFVEPRDIRVLACTEGRVALAAGGAGDGEELVVESRVAGAALVSFLRVPLRP